MGRAGHLIHPIQTGPILTMMTPQCRAAEGTAGAELPANAAPDVLDARCTLTSERQPSPVARPFSSELLLRKDTLRRWGSEQRTEAASAATTAPAIPATASKGSSYFNLHVQKIFDPQVPGSLLKNKSLTFSHVGKNFYPFPSE
ncbi:hypothetical protein IEQ34_009980 [Dendrobium chrysotoxum]|uniref:Uncharacterized protein n=1 Tax=Dendrobium chrysotoxum TaxID=161865 RepID=A0AAV7GKL3_DENCH|nr:hypothetical protein IEQ34_009980 [Dendrobium chrysotoxum]